MVDIVIAEAVRSAVGRAHKGSLALKRSDELAGEVGRALMARVPQGKPAAGGGVPPEGDQGGEGGEPLQGAARAAGSVRTLEPAEGDEGARSEAFRGRDRAGD